MVLLTTVSPGGDRCAGVPRRQKEACTGCSSARNRAFRSIIVPKHRWRARCHASRSGKKTVRPDIKKKNGLVQGSGGSEREKTSLQTRRDLVIMRVGRKKGWFGGSGNEKPARETRKEISFGSGRGKRCCQTRRKPKCSHVSQKNRRLYAKTGLQREKVLCRPVLILCTTQQTMIDQESSCGCM